MRSFVLALVLCVATLAHAEVKDSAALLTAPLKDIDDKPLSLRSLYEKGAGPVLIVLHQDRRSSDENPDFKEQLSKLTASAALRDRLRVVALADVGGYDFWPAKGYVRDALKPLRDGGGALVLCDWQGMVRKRYGLKTGQTTIFLLNSAGELRALKQGRMSSSEVTEFVQLVETLLRT